MGWMLGMAGPSIKQNLISHIQGRIPKPSIKFQSSNLYIQAGGAEKTCIGSILDAGNKKMGWIVCGVGISPDLDKKKHILTKDEWMELCLQPERNLSNLEGHFVAITYKGDDVLGYVSSNGLRELYLLPFNGNILFSTNLSWLCKISGRCQIDFHRFGSRWRGLHQFSLDSIIRPIERLGPGGMVQINKNEYRIKRPRDFSIPSSSRRLKELVELWVTFPLNQGYRVILLLSGGIDSRLLLSALMRRPKEDWTTCIFGDRNELDVLIAKNIAQTLNLNYYYFGYKIPDSPLCIKLMREFAMHTECSAPVSDALRLNFYHSLSDPQNIIIDGAFGEIMRRLYFNRLLFIRKFRPSPKGILRALSHRRADIFLQEINQKMEQGFYEDIQRLHLFENCDESYLDIVAIRTRLPNRFGPEQVRLDNILLTYSPFAQISILSAVLGIPLRWRKNGRFSRMLIKMNAYPLTRFHLVKDADHYPFSLSNKYLQTILKKSRYLLRDASKNTLSIAILGQIKEYVLDTLNSHSTRFFGPYDYKKITKMVEDFYHGNTIHADEILWWLTFELFRQECGL